MPLVFICWVGMLNAQFGNRFLNKAQSSASFVPLRYQTLNDSIGTGYGFPNPADNQTIVFSQNKPEGEKTKEWKELKVKYVEIYDDKPQGKILKTLLLKYAKDSANTKRVKTLDALANDTLRIYSLRKMKGAVANGLNELLYKNSEARLFGSIIWKGYYVPHQLVFFQTTELEVYDSEANFLNYNNQKAFKRSAKRVFKECPQILEKINKGAYFPRSRSNLKKLADDYELACPKN